ncbi:hypothetical protein B0H17DRAFT_1146292 [Mycena rosella]|uniref:Uncharacterized protein n=1 Tax=Mycena rosella TaxID=1033263 RepID=A0AAD7G4P1_MYCRO|nr:hypothetical protein B0H17DRAFT_1146292 [Mycena rosella]
MKPCKLHTQVPDDVTCRIRWVKVLSRPHNLLPGAAGTASLERECSELRDAEREHQISLQETPSRHRRIPRQHEDEENCAPSPTPGSQMRDGIGNWPTEIGLWVQVRDVAEIDLRVRVIFSKPSNSISTSAGWYKSAYGYWLTRSAYPMGTCK